MSEDPIIVLGLAGTTNTGPIDTIAPRAKALAAAGLADIRSVDVTPDMNPVAIQNALVDQMNLIRTTAPGTRFIVLKDGVRPLFSAKQMPDGVLSFGAAATLSAAELKDAIAEVRAFEIAVLPIKNAGPAPARPMSPPVTKIVLIQEPAKPAVPKPKILVLYYQPCNGAGIVTNPKAELTHAMVVPKDLQHAEFLTGNEGGLSQLDRKKLGALQSRVHGKPTFLREMVTHFGANFWGNKKFDTALATSEELKSVLRAGGYDGVVVVGDGDRKHYALLPQNIEALVQETPLDKPPFTRIVAGGDDLVNTARDAINDVVNDYKKAATSKPEVVDIVKQALAKAAGTDTEAPAIQRVRATLQMPASRALRPTRPAVPRSRSTHPHVLVLYAPGTADLQLHSAAADVDIDKALLLDHKAVGGMVTDEGALIGGFVTANGAIQKTALSAKQEAPEFIRAARADFGDNFDRHAKVFTQAETLKAYLVKHRPHGSARETKAYDEIVLVGDMPEGISITHTQIEEICAAHKNNKGVPCTFTHVPDVASLYTRFPAATIEQTLGVA